MRRKADPVIDKVWGEIERTLDSFGYELVQARLSGRGEGQMLMVLMDAPGGVTVRDCQRMASRLSVLMDVLDPIEGRYALVVSSPGVNRPLTKDADFGRFVGRKATIRSSQPGERARTRRGVLRGVAGDSVRLEVGGTEVLVALADIETANVVHDWDEVGTGDGEPGTGDRGRGTGDRGRARRVGEQAAGSGEDDRAVPGEQGGGADGMEPE